MIPKPIARVLSTLSRHEVQSLLMGGQACVLYGAAEFSRDTDFVILATPANLERLRQAMAELQAEVIAVPPFESRYLERGHAVHFRCHHPEAAEWRVDVMARLRGVRSFEELWEARTTLAFADWDGVIDLLSLPDLVQAKKTQRDKDWPMLKRLVDASFFQSEDAPTDDRVGFWLREMRTPELLREVCRKWPEHAKAATGQRPLLNLVLAAGSLEDLERALADEESRERAADRAYWQPLRKDLEQLRHDQAKGGPESEA